MNRFARVLLAAIPWLLFSTPAHAAPVIAAAALWITTALPFISAAVDTFIFYSLQAAAYVALSVGLSKLATPKGLGSSANLQDRQASVLSLSLGEGAREAIFGRAVTGGGLQDAFNFGGTYGTDWEVLVIQLADHQCHSLEGFYVGDIYYVFGGDGVQAGFNDQLEVYFYDGAFDQVASPYLLTNSPSRLNGEPWTSDDKLSGMAYVVVAYKADAPNADDPIWQGRPQLRWDVKGKHVYDPRLDSTVTGGSGAQRWDDPTTWTWSDNLKLCHYAYRRGIYAGDQVDQPSQLLIGRGLSALEAPPEAVIAGANVCDESVALLAGGHEPRYRVGGVISADMIFIQVDQMFADACGGIIFQHEGGIDVDPGVARASVRSITDADLLVDAPRKFSDFLSDAVRINTVTPRYVEPTQLWKSTAAPVRRSTADIADDGGPKLKGLDLALVTSGTQAQRVGEIVRRKARKEKRAQVPLAPRHSDLEPGDWISWTSARYLQGATRTFQVENVLVGEGRKTSLALSEIASSCFAWDEEADEGVPGHAPVDEPGSITGLELEGVAISAFDYVGSDGGTAPGILATWDAPVDPAIRAVRLDVRVVDTTEITPTFMEDPNAGELTTTNGVGPGLDLEARVCPVSTPGRRTTASAWIPVTSNPLSVAGVGAALGDGDLTPGEKLYVVPFIQSIINARSALRDRADALNLLYSNNLERVAYEDAQDDLDAILATWDDPVDWDDRTDLTHIPDPAAAVAALTAAQTSERNLQTQIDAIYGTRIEDIEANVADLAGQISDGVLTVQEKLHTFIWTINQLQFAQAQLRASADAFKLTVALGDAERIAFEAADTALDAILAGLTSPVAWNNYTDTTTISDPAGLATAISNMATTEKALQAKINTLNGTTIVDSGTGALLTSAQISNALWKLPSVNLFRKPDWSAFGSSAASTASPGFGRAGWGFTLGNIGSGANGVADTRAGFATGEPYSPSFHAKLTTGSGTATIRAGWRDSGGAALSDVADVLFTVTTTEQRFVMPNVISVDSDIAGGHFRIFQNAGDIASGKVVTVADLMMEHANSASMDWRPSPDDPDLLRYATYVGSLDADKTSANTAAAISGQGALATKSTADYGSDVGGTKPPTNADQTSSHTAAAISGQGNLATANGNYGSSDPGGADGSFWGDTSSHTLKYRAGGSWVVVATNVGGISATASPTSVAGFRSGAGGCSTNSTTVTPSGDSSYSYQWVALSGDAPNIGSPTSATTTFSRTLALGQDFSGVARCYVTGAGGATTWVDVPWSVAETS